MSLLNRGEPITVRRAEPQLGRDGNVTMKPGAPAIIIGVIQPATVSADDSQGYLTTEDYRLRPVPGTAELPDRTEVDYDGETFYVVGPPKKFRGSSRTAHDDYLIRRA